MTPPAARKSRPSTSTPTTTHQLSLVDTDPAELAVDAVVIGVHSQTDSKMPLLPATGAESITAAFDGKLSETLTLLGATGAANEITKLATLGTVAAPIVVAVGLGPEPSGAAPAADILRKAAATAIRSLAGTAKVALALPLPDEDAEASLRGIAEGALLGNYQFAGYKAASTARKAQVKAVLVGVPDAKDKAAKAELTRAEVLAAAVAQCRDWVNAAPNELRPPSFAKSVADLATEAGLTVEVWDEKALKKGGFGGILAVGMGSEAPPRLVKISYTPAKKSKAPKVALVGKGITFDTGGVSIKPAAGMWEMKSDMGGAAAVAAVMLAVAKLKPAMAITAYVPMAENMPSATAYRPGDVVTMYGGKTVEVLNTDAEGRMILADAITLACQDGCDYLVETATLTCGQITALGKKISGLMGTTELLERVQAAGAAVGEPMWAMPLPEEIRRGMDSDIADICQINAKGDRGGHMLQGGAFLSDFVAEGVSWAHIDIAGPSFHVGEPSGYLAKGGTGIPVRTIVELLGDLASNG